MDWGNLYKHVGSWIMSTTWKCSLDTEDSSFANISVKLILTTHLKHAIFQDYQTEKLDLSCMTTMSSSGCTGHWLYLAETFSQELNHSFLHSFSLYIDSDSHSLCISLYVYLFVSWSIDIFISLFFSLLVFLIYAVLSPHREVKKNIQHTFILKGNQNLSFFYLNHYQ